MAKRSRPKKPAKTRPSRAKQGTLVDNPSSRLNAAQRLLREGRHNDAVDLFNEAVRVEPNNVRAYVMSARAYAELFQFERMEAIHAKLIARAPKHPGVHHYIGETFAHLKLPHRAIECFETAVGLEDSAAPTWMELASLYESAHRLDEAEQLIERAVDSGYDIPLVWLVRGRIQRRQSEPEKAEATFRELIERAPKTSWACQAWGEIALMKDRQGDYPAAIEAIAECKKLQMVREDRYITAAKNAHEKMRRLFADLTRDDLRRWRDLASQLSPQPVALLTGFPRSGTTLLEQLLDAHPGLISSEERDFVGKELIRQVLSRQGNAPILELYNKVSLKRISDARQQYLPVMEYMLGEPVGDRMHLDKNPAYNLTLPLMFRFFPETCLVVALRDPRDVVLSCYLRYLPMNAVSVSFMTPQRAAERYALDMGAWLRMRELVDSPWCEVRYEDTVDAPETQARRALETLGLDWRDDVLKYRERLGKEKMVTSPTYEAVAQPVHKGAIGRWRNYAEILEPALETLQPFLKEFGYE